MSASHRCGSTRRQLPPTPSCQCHALLSYKLRPQPVFRPEAPEESVKELVDDIFRMGTAYLIRSGERIPPAEMAYFECLNEIDVSERIVPLRPEMDQLFGPFDGVPDGHRASRPRTSLEDVVHSDAIQEAEQQTEELGSAEPQESKSDPDTKLASPAVARYITEDQLGTMGWKDLFKLARARKVVHGPMMRSRRELVRKFVEKFGVEIPIYEDDKLPREFPSKHSTRVSSFEMGLWEISSD